MQVEVYIHYEPIPYHISFREKCIVQMKQSHNILLHDQLFKEYKSVHEVTLSKRKEDLHHVSK